ncbi:MAG: hypothetical protein KDD84_21995, partial [Caldilineaceae bacterium]|nr:hypothetical protein [Caldilineaceae bacterium]
MARRRRRILRGLCIAIVGVIMSLPQFSALADRVTSARNTRQAVLPTSARHAIDDERFSLWGRIVDKGGFGVAGVSVRADPFGEPNDTCTTARWIAPDGASQQHTYASADDEDWFIFNAEQGEEYLIEAFALPGSDADNWLQVYSRCDTSALADQNHSFSPDARLRVSTSSSRPLYLRMRNDAISNKFDQPYMLSVRRLEHAPTTKAAVVVAGRRHSDDPQQRNFYHSAETFYTFLQNRGYGAEEIYYIAPETRLGGISKPALVTELR